MRRRIALLIAAAPLALATPAGAGQDDVPTPDVPGPPTYDTPGVSQDETVEVGLPPVPRP